MTEARLFLATLTKEFQNFKRSTAYLMIMAADVVLSLMIAYSFLNTSTAYSKSVFQIVYLGFSNSLYNYFLIFLLAPSISISEEKELGTWDILRVQSSDDTGIVFGKVVFQVFFAIILVLISLASLFLMQLIMYGGFPSETLRSVTTTYTTYQFTPYGSAETVLTKTWKIPLLSSAIQSMTVFAVSAASAIVLVLASMCLSRAARTRFGSIILAVIFYLVVTIGYQLIVGTLTKTPTVPQTVFLSMNPNFLFSLAGELTGLTSVGIVNGTYTYYTNLTGTYYDPLILACLMAGASIIYLTILFLPRKLELMKWIRKPS